VNGIIVRDCSQAHPQVTLEPSSLSKLDEDALDLFHYITRFHLCMK